MCELDILRGPRLILTVTMGFFLTHLWIIDYFNFGKFVFNLNRSLVHGFVVHFGLNVNIFFDGRGCQLGPVRVSPSSLGSIRRCKNSVASTMNYIRNWAILLSPACYLFQFLHLLPPLACQSQYWRWSWQNSVALWSEFSVSTTRFAFM